MKTKKEIVYKRVEHEGYGFSHEPLHKLIDGCRPCEEFRVRRNRNTRAGRVVGVEVRSGDPAGACHNCLVPVFRGSGDEADVWAWNQNVDRAQWSLEEARAGAPPTHCPRCRKAAA